MISKKKIIAMVPARLGSQRVPRKNLRMIDGKPLIAYCLISARQAGVFDEIYINSESEVFAEIANDYGVQFHRRPEALSSNKIVNDEFAFEFINKIPGDICIQILPTSPLITPDEIKDFVKAMLDGEYETFVSVVNHQIPCLYESKPVNFSLTELNKPSQTMKPVQSYATVLMGWTYDSFKRNMKKFGCAFHGGDSKIGYYLLSGLSTIDIDNEEDFALAEVAMHYRKNRKSFPVKFYQS